MFSYPQQYPNPTFNLLDSPVCSKKFRSINLLVTMLSALLAALFVTQRYGKKEGGVEEEKKKKKLTGKEKAEAEELRQDFDSFKAYYIGVYAVIMLADWMQGTHMYTLYLSYGVDISTLFLTGFLSGAIFAPFLGSVVDKVGRKNSCIVYCVLEIVINTMEHSTNFKILMFGRVLGGISTNLLFSAFESWMTTEHRKQGFPEDWLKEIYAAASVTNGVTAVAAGIVAQQLEDWLGHIGPFKGAVALTVLALILVLRWEENYGEDKGENSGSSVVTQFKEQFKEGWSATLSNPDILKIGLIQSLGEGAMYTFVFLGLWSIALFTGSRAALALALFQHAYIWVHWYCTEQPDGVILYGRSPDEDA